MHGRFTKPSTMPMSVAWKARLQEMNASYLTDPGLAALHDRLLSYGGEEVALTHEEDLQQILERGVLHKGRSVKPRRVWWSKPISCHQNSAYLYKDNRTVSPGRFDIVTGWALSKDGVWRQHTWVYDNQRKKVVETTVKRVLYYGFHLTPAEAEKFSRAQRCGW